ncbi:hypothetical protein KUV50_11150 [Membranicola marinus]|uniref:Uncharacterized protein n=1 Tax=Membranihabitans marinus TaxID=1227546 RepID=A0A953LDB8_9BACT|nr:hypothetical protein [Membranihabitans marinus]MBY5958694.1 hypothetical protein [Membranihabitans marinus]
MTALIRYILNSLEDDQVFKIAWRIQCSYDNAFMHHMYFSDRYRIMEEKINLTTEIWQKST